MQNIVKTQLFCNSLLKMLNEIHIFMLKYFIDTQFLRSNILVNNEILNLSYFHILQSFIIMKKYYFISLAFIDNNYKTEHLRILKN